jgi:hypothetical protein
MRAGRMPHAGGGGRQPTRTRPQSRSASRNGCKQTNKHTQPSGRDVTRSACAGARVGAGRHGGLGRAGFHAANAPERDEPTRLRYRGVRPVPVRMWAGRAQSCLKGVPGYVPSARRPPWVYWGTASHGGVLYERGDLPLVHEAHVAGVLVLDILTLACAAMRGDPCRTEYRRSHTPRYPSRHAMGSHTARYPTPHGTGSHPAGYRAVRPITRTLAQRPWVGGEGGRRGPRRGQVTVS